MQGWGPSCMGIKTGGKWSVEERKFQINILELLVVKNPFLAFTKEKAINAVDIQTNCCPLIPSENGRYGRQDTCRYKQGHLEVSDIEADHNYCRKSPRYSEHKSRLAVSSQQGLLGIEVISNSIPTYFPENGDASDSSVCFQIIQSNSKIFCLETRPPQFSYGCNVRRMEPGNSTSISPVFVNSESTLQNSKGECLYSNIDNSSMAKSILVSKSSCIVAKLLKTWKKGRTPPKLEIFAFQKDTNLCVIETLKLYLDRSQEWRDEKNTQLLLGINKPHKSFSVSTVPRWIKDVMSLSGIDVSLLKGYSTGSASTSRASLFGASIQEFLGKSRWSNESTWQKFYKKPLVYIEKNRIQKAEYFVIGTPSFKQRIMLEFRLYLILLGSKVLSISSDWDFMK